MGTWGPTMEAGLVEAFVGECLVVGLNPKRD